MKGKSNLQMSFDLEKMYDVNDVKLGFNYWVSKLLQITLFRVPMVSIANIKNVLIG